MIFTFYSYKGGVGRSMAMANIAELFFRAGLKVLIVDWDLEAPGLEKFFFSQERTRDEARDNPNLSPNEVMNKQGVIDMLLDYKEKMTQEIETESEEDLPFLKPEDLAIDLYPDWPGKGKLKLLTAGRRSQGYFSEYVNSVLNFDWQDFYNNWHGELYFEWMRHKLEKMADVVLIDSRTGVTEMGGVCTYQFADIIIVFCAPNKQNLDGSFKMATKFKLPKLVEVRGDRPLDVLIVPSRVEDRAETELLNNFRKEFIEKFRGFIPEAIDEGEETLWRLRIPQVPYYAFGELVAVRESGKARSDDLLTAFRTLAKTMDALGSMGIGDILGGTSTKNADINPQNLRDFTVQIRDPITHAPMGTGIIISIDGKILTSYRVVQKAIGADPFYARDKIVEIYIPRLRVEEQQQTATVTACMSKYEDDIVLLQLKNGSMSLRQDQVAILGMADRSSNHTFRSYGFSRAANYSDTYSKGTILGDISLPTFQSLRLDPFQLESSQGNLDMPGAPVLDVDLNLIVGIISEISAQEAGKAIAVNAHMLAFEPFKIPIQANMGDAYVKQGKYKDAIIAYKDAIDVDSRYSQSWIGLGRAYALMGKYGDATAAFENATNVDSSSGLAWFELGRLYKRLNRYDEAIRAYEKAIENDPYMAVAWLEKGGIYLEQKIADKAILAYKRAIELDENMSQAWQELGNAYTKMEMYADAIKAYENALRIDPGRMLEIGAKRDLSIKADQEQNEKKKHLLERDMLQREKEKLQYQNEMLQKEKYEQRNEKNHLLKEKDELLKKTEKLQYEKEIVAKSKKWQIGIAAILLIFTTAGFAYINYNNYIDYQNKLSYYEVTASQANELESLYIAAATENDEIHARYLAAQSMLSKSGLYYTVADLSLSRLLALESLKKYWTIDGYNALQNSLISPKGSGLHGDREQDFSQFNMLRPIYNEGPIDKVAQSLDGALLAIASGNSIQLWNLTTLTPLGNEIDLGEDAKKILFSRDGRLLAALGDNGTVKIWSTNSQRELIRRTSSRGYDISFNYNGTQLALANGYSVQLLKLAENLIDLNKLINRKGMLDIRNAEWINISNRKYIIIGIAFSKDGDFLAIVSNDGVMLNMVTGEESSFLDKINYINKSIVSFSFNQDGTSLAISNTDEVDIWNMNGELMHRMNISGGRTLALSPNGNSLAMARSFSRDMVIEIYDIKTNNTLKIARDTEGLILAGPIRFSPDGKLLFASFIGSNKKINNNRDDSSMTLYILNASSGEELAKLDLGYNIDIAYSFYMYTRYYRYGYSDRNYPSIEPNIIYFSNAKQIGTINNDTIYIWPIDTKFLMDKTCDILDKDGLSQDEWIKYMGTEPYTETCPCSEVPIQMMPIRDSHYGLQRNILNSNGLDS